MNSPSEKFSELLVSVLMPVHNAERFVSIAVDSILKQSLENIELVVVNDGSTDSSVDALSQFADRRLRLIHNEKNLGLSATLNRGLSMCRGSYIARMDADDIAHPDRIKLQVDFLNNHPDVLVVGSSVHLLDQFGKRIGERIYPTSCAAIKWQLLFDSAICHPTAMLRKGVVESVGGYRYANCEDYDLWIRIAKVGGLANLSTPLLDYRIHSNSFSVYANNGQSNQRLQLSRANVSSLSPHALDEPTLDTLATPQPFNSYIDALRVARDLKQLYDNFCSVEACSVSDKMRIASDIATRLKSSMGMMAFSDRVKFIFGAARFFPISFWTRLEVLSFFPTERHKRLLRRCIGRTR